MPVLRVRRAPSTLMLVLALFLLPSGCGGSRPDEVIDVSLRNTETYEYPTVGGDEEGAAITTQAEHFSISEIRRGAATNWIAVYVYRPAEGYVGSDYAEIEVHSGSDGASAPTDIRTIAFRFSIRE